MVTHTYTTHRRVRSAAKAFIAGCTFGLILQGITVSPNQGTNEAWLLSKIQKTVQSVAIVQPTPTLPSTTMTERVYRRRLLRSAQKQGMRLFVVADADMLHTAAPVSAAVSISAFPSFDRAVFPVSQVPNWGAMHTAALWNRTYAQMSPADFVPVPTYDLSVLSIPLSTVQRMPQAQSEAIITAKLFYSTRYFAAYDIDADEFTGLHSGIDLKLPLGTPVAAIGGGIVRYAQNEGALGLHVMIEHRLGNGDVYFSLYGHLRSTTVRESDAVTPGQIIGEVGVTGDTTGPHLHLQVDRGDGSDVHTPYEPTTRVTQSDVGPWSVNPITFIRDHQ